VYQPDRAAAAVTALRCLVERASLDGKSVASKYGHDMVFDSVNVNDYNVAHVTGVSGLECTTFTVEPDCMTADPAKIVREVHGPERCPVIEE
jgi:hypothetical protein